MKMLRKILFVVLCILLIVFLQFGFIYIVVALLPSIMAYVGDRDEGKPTFRIIFLCNAAAFLPTFMPMLVAGVHFRHYDVMEKASNMELWLLFYSGAAAGWGLIYLSRYFSRFLVSMNSDIHITRLESMQQKLVEEWGDAVYRNAGAVKAEMGNG